MSAIRMVVAMFVVLMALTGRPAAPTPANGAADPFAQLRILVTGNDRNVYLIDGDGRKLRQVTSHANASVFYPRYSWSPDHRYALLVRAGTNQAGDTTLLLNSSGALVSTLLKSSTELYPSWAFDADTVAYLAHDQSQSTCGASLACDTLTIGAVDIHGKTLGTLWTRTLDTAIGCGGGGELSAPAVSQAIEDSMYPRSIQWSSTGPLAVVDDQDLCPGWTAIVDRSTGTVTDWLDTNLNICGHPGSYLQLSPTGTMYVVETFSGQTPEIMVCSDRGPEITALPGQAPGWWIDGTLLYYSDCQAGECAIYLVDFKKGTYGRISDWEPAYALGPMQPVAGALIFSRIEVLKNGNARVSVQRFDAKGFTTIATWASRPVA